MKVVHLSYYGPEGQTGGAIATRRLHFWLRKAGIDSKVLNIQKTDKSFHFETVKSTKSERAINAILKRYIFAPLSLNGVGGVGSLKIRNHKAYHNADIINLHRIYDFFSYLALPWLTENKPTVFTLHDMWALTGHCYQSLGCDRWKTGCGNCPHPSIAPPIKRDNTRLEWKMKKWVYHRSNLSVVTLSRWKTEIAKQSILGHLPIHHIPHGIDMNVFEPLDKKQCRSMLGIPTGKKVLTFVAQHVHAYIKGGDLLMKALDKLPRSLKKNVILLLLGHGGFKFCNSVDIQTINLDYVKNERLKAICYSAADIFLNPTRAESFGLTMLESIACGTPVVAFRVGAVPDLVRSGLTGYLANPWDIGDYCNGIVELLEDESQHALMSRRCREIALKEYSIELMVQRYIKLYQQLMKG
jgi:glycosyltransferase involved in cell wall biosynthesis